MYKHIGTIARGALLAGGLVLLGAAQSTAQNKAVPPQPVPKTPPPAETPQKTNPAVPPNTKGTPPNPATPSDKASQKALQTPSRTGEAGRQANVQLTEQAQTMMNSLGSMNLQNFNATKPTIVNATDVLNQTQIQDLLQALNSNPQALQNAQRLTEQLRASGRIGANDQIVGFMNGQLFVAHGTGAVTAVQLAPQAQNMLNGMTGLNLQNFNVSRQQVVNATDVLNQNQVQDLINTLNSNPQARQMAQRLTDMLRATGKLQPNQQVVGFADGKIFVAAKVPPIPDLVSGLATLNLQSFNPQTIVIVTDLLNPTQVTELIVAMNNNPQARQIALQLTEQLLAKNTINPDQFVVGFMDGKVMVALTAQQFDILINGLINADLQNVNQLNIISFTDILRKNQVEKLLQTLMNNVDAHRNATQMTQQMQSSGKIRRDQRVVGFMNGSAVVAPLPER
jgi:hypothetical protein